MDMDMDMNMYMDMDMDMYVDMYMVHAHAHGHVNVHLHVHVHVHVQHVPPGAVFGHEQRSCRSAVSAALSTSELQLTEHGGGVQVAGGGCERITVHSPSSVVW